MTEHATTTSLQRGARFMDHALVPLEILALDMPDLTRQQLEHVQRAILESVEYERELRREERRDRDALRRRRAQDVARRLDAIVQGAAR